VERGEVERRATPHASQQPGAAALADREAEPVEQRQERLVDEVTVHLPQQWGQDARQHLVDPAVVRSASLTGESKPSPTDDPSVVMGRAWTTQRVPSAHAHSTSCGAAGEHLDAGGLPERRLDLGWGVGMLGERIEHPRVGGALARHEGLGEPVDRLDARSSRRHPGSTVKVTPARSAGTIRMTTTAIAASSSSIPSAWR
jgi:hypothetical protein